MTPNNIQTTIDMMVWKVNQQTAYALSETAPSDIPVLFLLGRPGSRYLLNVEREARRFGVETIRLERGDSMSREMAEAVANLEDAGCPYDVIWDDEDETTEELFKTYCRRDLDRTLEKTPGKSCTANAIMLILYALDMDKKHIAIVGRGHAVKGLNHSMVFNGATTTQCHSETENINGATYVADVVVNTAHPETPDCCLRGKMILDVSGTLAAATAQARLDCIAYREREPAYIDRHQIGRVNVAVLLNRFAKEDESHE